MHSITISGTTFEEIKSGLAKWTKELGVAEESKQLSFNLSLGQDGKLQGLEALNKLIPPAQTEEVAAEKPKRGRPKSQPTDTATHVSGAVVTASEIIPPVSLFDDEAPVALTRAPRAETKEAAHAALDNLLANSNIEECKKVLTVSGVGKRSELKPEQYADFIDACTKAQTDYLRSKALA